MRLWLEGSDRPDALHDQPGTISFATPMKHVAGLWSLCELAFLEGSRLEESGSPARAWPWYRGVLRSSRHLGRNSWIRDRVLGADLHLEITRRILRWASDSRIDAPMLRRALQETQAADTLTPPLSRVLKTTFLVYDRDMVENVAIIDSFSDHWPPPGGPSWMDRLTLGIGPSHYARYQWLRVKACNDPERSRRVLRLLFASWLAQADRPASHRAPVAVGEPTLVYAPDPLTPPSARAIEPKPLIEALEHSILARYAIRGNDPDQEGKSFLHGDQLWEGHSALARERRRQAALVVRLAAELYRRERGSSPAGYGSSYGAYLRDLPEGIAPKDPIPAGLE